MPACENSSWTINISNDKTPGQLETLFFDLQINGGNVTGKVELDSIKLSDVSGSCAAIPSRDISVMQLTFTWGRTGIFLVGVTFFESPLTKFKGRFLGFAAEVPLALDLKTVHVPPDPGDTGTGTGQQT
ncbi:MAG TPA: hypothetical protein VFV34_11060 [Blastocatellia bacterium]|nr:hypothetical protein [Blastocatellia bacterium]